jgi:hypothetical protein
MTHLALRSGEACTSDDAISCGAAAAPLPPAADGSIRQLRAAEYAGHPDCASKRVSPYNGRAVHVDPTEPNLKAPRYTRLKLRYDQPLSIRTCAGFNSNLLKFCF